ncbi:cell division protein [Pusillimonas sp. T2]|uniref:SPOR domain-containing protein n=1 Tax=Pusillimonas sp. T2 TaxID=1548123 RepID=UPI000B9C91D2|nr:SPOR domain-containing protein [Pusillimonas sp. T2]OXR48767.1 cell division protein [Pusillimonas sp. T2]
MAKSRKSNASMFKGSSLFTLLFGLILGLAIAAGVAWFVTQVPMPFTDKFSRSAPTTQLPDVRDAPDPNQALMGRGGAGAPADAAAVTPPQALPGSAPGVTLQDDIGALLTTLGAPAANTARPTAPAAAAGSNKAPAAKPAPGTQTTYYLQAGAFRAEADAQAMRARILLLGEQAQVQPAQINGTTLYRVRVGPYKGIDDMNRSRVTLSNAKIDTTVVKP